MAFAEQVTLDALEPADEAVREAAQLRHLPCERSRFRAHSFADGVADTLRQRGLQLGRRLRQPFDPVAGPLERRLERCRLDAALGDQSQAPPGVLECVCIHEA